MRMHATSTHGSVDRPPVRLYMHAPHRTHFFIDLPRPRPHLPPAGSHTTPPGPGGRPAWRAAAVSTSHHNNRRMLLASCYALVGVLVLLSSTACTSHAAAASGEYQTFIVLLERPSGAGEMDASAHRAWHESLLPSKFTEHGEPRLLRSYRFLLNGFSALLTEAELQQVASKPGFVAAFPNGVRHLDTTRTPAFLGLYDEGAGRVATWKDTDYGAGAIIGVLDPRHPSMSDIVLPKYTPSRWKGSCYQGYCNRKLIGAKNMVRPWQSPMDEDDGHGTHTASIAAGSFVNDVSVYGGLANGSASGMAPWAHVAIYKVCERKSCREDAIVHAMDQAGEDGVDVISLSISSPVTKTYDRDIIAVAAYGAMEKGIPVVASAGNTGPGASTVRNDVPWIFTVGAGTVDRSLEAKLRFTTGGIVLGQYRADRKKTQVPDGSYPVLYSEDGDRRYCLYPESEKQALFRDKIVICEVGRSTPARGDPIKEAVTKYNAAAAVAIHSQTAGYTFGLWDYGTARPIVQVSYDERERLKAYASSPAARASIELGDTVVGPSIQAPIAASFSGKGPNKRSPGILKPDIIAPGVNILAGVPDAHPRAPWDLKSGTSMATPHVSGLVALFRILHPQWSPAAIRSAFVTTADVVDNTGKPIQDAAAGAFSIGAGHVNVGKALDPGLVYDLNQDWYRCYVCSVLGDAALRRVTRNNSVTCVGYLPISDYALNYHSITVPLQTTPISVLREVTNVAPQGPPEVYAIKVDMPPEVNVTFAPSILRFTYPGEKAMFAVKVSSSGSSSSPLVNGRVYQGSLTLLSTSHKVRTPLIAVVGLPKPWPSTGP